MDDTGHVPREFWILFVSSTAQIVPDSSINVNVGTSHQDSAGESPFPAMEGPFDLGVQMSA